MDTGNAYLSSRVSNMQIPAYLLLQEIVETATIKLLKNAVLIANHVENKKDAVVTKEILNEITKFY